MLKILIVLGILTLIEVFIICYKVGVRCGRKGALDELFEGAQINLTEFDTATKNGEFSAEDNLTFLGIVYDLESPTYQIIKNHEKDFKLIEKLKRLENMQEKLKETEIALSKEFKLTQEQVNSNEFKLASIIAQIELLNFITKVLKDEIE